MKINANIIPFFIVFITIIILASCNNNSEMQKTPATVDPKQRKESLEKANRYVVIKENEDIKDYIERHQLDVVETGTGLRYCVVRQGDGELIRKGDVVSMDYEVRLLNGETLYGSNKDGVKTFVVGRGGVEKGLEEAVLYLHKGDVATIIIPSHLGYGLLGDGDKIPSKATLVYKVKILNNCIK